ncbi:type I restriction-modification system subunit M [Acinetobacter baumannii]|uniref:type I restriction-modification system subunit M n=1 Tax=Acinetobacter baumannii TaxID=470 RepID=UPI00244B0970|nr:class I SAM-dependent DNA methyltransferase [Acinetobacter baumannii]MDH2571858.1 class I SAM-dependent DNA methyltransferase [Acinetobacter baumannii]
MNLIELKQLEDQLWSAADSLRANTDLKPNEYSTPVLGLIFLKFADNKYGATEEAILKEYNELKGSRREKSIAEIAIKHCGFYLPDNARYNYLLELPDSENLAKKIKEAMQEIEDHQGQDDFKGVLPKEEYQAFNRRPESRDALRGLMRSFSNIPVDASGDVFGKIYEYFLGKFALSEGQKGGEFFTPTSVVRLMVEMIEPFNGSVYDPACGSGGMFVQSLQFVERRKELNKKLGAAENTNHLFVYGQEKTLDTVKLAKMNLFVNGLKGEIQQANSYAEDPFKGFGKFDYVMANPPFNVDDVAVTTVENDPRFNTYGLPRNKTKAKKTDDNAKIETVPNANYLWINLFATSLKNAQQAQLSNSGRAALVMPNSASDARNSEAEVRQRLIENNLIYGMLTLPSNMFYTVTLPATLWFFDKNKTDDKILFIDARNIFRQIDRAHRDFTDEQILNIAMISKLHKGRNHEYISLIDDYFRQGMAKLEATVPHVEPSFKKLKEALKEDAVIVQSVDELNQHWHALKPLKESFDAYVIAFPQVVTKDLVADLNGKQKKLRASFTPFFKAIAEEAKVLDKAIREKEKSHNELVKLTRAEVAEAKANDKKDVLKAKEAKLKELNTLTADIKEVKVLLADIKADRSEAEYFFNHISWLQERFPNAEYEDVTGLCKLATPEDVTEQDYSLNAGRYVGVVIEEDGRTEEEFSNDLMISKDKFIELTNESKVLENLILSNLNQIIGG